VQDGEDTKSPQLKLLINGNSEKSMNLMKNQYPVDGVGMGKGEGANTAKNGKVRPHHQSDLYVHQLMQGNAPISTDEIKLLSK
jgi:hypothetical protein